MKTRLSRIGAPLGAILLAALFFASGALATRADEASASSASTPSQDAADAEAFQKSIKKSRFPWLSTETGEAKYLPREEVKTRPVRVRQTPRRDGSETAAALATVLSWTVVSLFFVAVVVALIMAIRSQMFKNMVLKKRRAAEAAARERRINALAPEAAEQYDDLFASAKNAYGRGDYRRALIFYFSYLLVEMDKREFVLLAKGKTNLEYWRELVDFTELRAIYRTTMNAFERVYFGGTSISKEEFDDVWALQPRFEEIMREKDEEERLRREAEELRRQSKGVKVSASILLIAAVSLASCLGCSSGKKEEKWKSEYGYYVSVDRKKSLNSATAYLDYCRRNTKWKLTKVRFNYLSGESFAKLTKNQDAIICFDSPGYGDTPFSDPYWSEVDFFPRAKDRSAQLQAVEANLRRYVQATDDDFDQFAVTETTVNFSRIEKEIVWWLNAKPNRTFVLVARGWDALPFYLLDSREALINSGASENDSQLRECDRLLSEYMRQVKSLSKSVAIEEDSDGNFVFPSGAPLLTDRRGTSPKLEFHVFREEQKGLLSAPLKHASYLVGLFNDEEYEEAKKLLPAELVEAIMVEVDRLATRKKSKELVGDSEFSTQPFSMLSVSELQDLDSWDDMRDDEKWRLAFQIVHSRSMDDDPPLADGDVLFRNVFDDGTDWPTTTDDEKNASSQEDSDRKIPPDPFFVTRFDPSSFGAWPGVEEVFNKDDEYLNPRSLVRKGKFGGEPKWTEGLPEEAPLREFCKLEPRGDTKVLLSQGDIPLVCERKIGESRLLIVNSTSFLSNYGLTDPVNQKLAAKLTRELPPKSKTLVFLDAVNVLDEIPEIPKEEDGPFSLKKLTPFTIFIWHVVFLGACAIFCAYPIFGRPKRLGRERMNDFSRHVNAYARELENIGAEEWARKQIDAYRDSDNLPEL